MAWKCRWKQLSAWGVKTLTVNQGRKNEFRPFLYALKKEELP